MIREIEKEKVNEIFLSVFEHGSNVPKKLINLLVFIKQPKYIKSNFPQFNARWKNGTIRLSPIFRSEKPAKKKKRKIMFGMGINL